MVTATILKIVSPCWKPSVEGEDSNRGAESSGRVDGLLWYKDSGNHVGGEFSMAVIQANNLLEDHSQLESGPLSSFESGPQGTFVGIYDGHGGPEAARFVNKRLFDNIKTIHGAEFTSESPGMSADVITKAFLETEEEFLTLVRNHWLIKPQIASVGSCCLVGIICAGLLYIANAGDSRVVLGRLEDGVKEVKAVQLSYEHNASIESVREELHSLHPDDPQIVVLKNKVWRVKGIIQVSRSIGDAYLKNAEFNTQPLLPKFRLPEPFHKPILKAEPTILVQKLYPEDQFLIFASDGLWEHLTNQEAVDIVHSCPRNGVARKLLKAALREAAKKREMRYSDLKKIDRGVRRHFHDDITVIVLFLDSYLISRGSWRGPLASIKGALCCQVNITVEACKQSTKTKMATLNVSYCVTATGSSPLTSSLSDFSPAFSKKTIRFPGTRKFSHPLEAQKNEFCFQYRTFSRVLIKKARATRLSPTMAATKIVQEVLPPALDSTSELPPIFDGTPRLYISYTCPYAQRVWITRNCKGLQDKIKLVPIDLKNRPDWYKDLVYPPNKVPSLEHNNEVKGESLDLIKYIDSHFEGPSLFPDDPAKKDFAEELFSYTDSFNKAVISTCKGDGNEAGAALDYIETALSKFHDGPFFLGQFSLVDIAYAPFIERFQPYLLDVKKYDITAGRPKLAAWIEEMNKNEGFNQTRCDPQELIEIYKSRFAARL